ncbi:hypothetical protein E3J38_04530 [candidate division TA06 bacterium]|uniref:Uncharacterized protein n=1 Tax=candidate division TA06 bacterium TaxID=2250710 RepID=A0A523XP75_UNCT6|nr:MAG: hypothetical protein E3J38_04530 [candidate division TA06 bacterium]
MHRRKTLWCLCVFLAVFIVLPRSGFCKRRPLLNLIEAPEGEGRRYVAAQEGQFFRTSVLYIRQGQGRKDTTEIWFVEVPDETSYVHGYMLTRNVNVIVEAAVTFDSTTKDYRYRYTLQNLEGSPREAGVFEVAFDPSLPFSDFVAPQTSRHPWQAWARWKQTNPEFWERSGRPLRWHGTLTLGESLGGFSYRSPVLPGIVHCWSNCFIPDGRSFFLRGNTPGPVASPDPFDPQKFLERLSAIIDESLKEGWIEDENVAEDLKKRLESAREAIESGNEKRLKSILSALPEKVEEEKDRSLLSEAYGLLKYNIQYWLDQLK